MAADDEGYSCKIGALDFWVIIDRYSVVQEQYPASDDYGEARDLAERLNDGVIARRLRSLSPAPKPKEKARVAKPPPVAATFEDALASLDLF